MSTVFKKIKKSIDKGVATVSVKSSSIIEINKIKVHMDSLSEKIARKKNELGETIYNLYEEGLPSDEAIETISQEILALKYQLMEKEKEIELIKEEEVEILGNDIKEYICKCGNEVSQGNSFCTKCGEKIG